MQPYRLSLDLGTNSLGWCVLDLDHDGNPKGIRRMGVRIFTDGRSPKDKTSLAVARRIARQMRRRRDRTLVRTRRLMTALIRFGLMPVDRAARKALERLDPFDLRARGLTERLEPYEIGRALFHINRRRGFKAVRASGDQKKAKEDGKIRAAARKLDALLAETGTPTLGAFFAWRLANGYGVRARLSGRGADAEYPFYPERRMLEEEFDRLWAAQARHHPIRLTEEARDVLRRRVFHQRPLRPPAVGKCSLFPEVERPFNERAPRALPSAQRFRLFQELANLKVVSPDLSKRPLTMEERDLILRAVKPAGKSTKKSITFTAIARTLKFDSSLRFSHETESRTELLIDETAAILSDKKLFGPRWTSLTLAEQDEIVERLLADTDAGALIDWLVARWGVDADTAARIADATLPDFHLSIGRHALAQLLPIMERDAVEGSPIRYDEAVERLGLHHSDRRPGALLATLPYYGKVLTRHVAFGTGEPSDENEERRHGRLANPTVHIGLNQVRLVVNAVIERYGPPHNIVVELARPLKQSQEKRREADQQNAKNRKKNELRKELIRGAGKPINARNLLKVRLWEEQGANGVHTCSYSGQTISIARLLSDEVDIDHILPFSRSLDDSPANKVVCLTGANRKKRNLTPYEAFEPDPQRLAEVLVRAAELPSNKRWRFEKDALERAAGEGGFLDRQLVDTHYLARVTRAYLGHVCGSVRVSPGRLTALLRRRWGANSILRDHNRGDDAADDRGAAKNRDNHLHHAIDAAVIGCTDQGMVTTLQTAAGRAEEVGDRLFEDLDPPWEGFRNELAARVRAMAVSHRPEHGTGGPMHEDTAYGPTSEAERAEGWTLVYRKPFDGLTEKEVAAIRATDLREAVRAALATHRRSGLDHKQAMPRVAAELAAGSRWPGIRHVRIKKKEADPVWLDGPDGVPYKGLIPGENHHVDIVALPDGRWIGHAVTLFEARRMALPNGRAAPYVPKEGERFVMRLHKGDLVKLEHDGRLRVMQVHVLEPSENRVRLAEHFEAGSLQERHDKPTDLEALEAKLGSLRFAALDDVERRNAVDPFRWLIISYDVMRRQRARRVTVDPLGRVCDPGFPKWAATGAVSRRRRREAAVAAEEPAT